MTWADAGPGVTVVVGCSVLVRGPDMALWPPTVTALEAMPREGPVQLGHGYSLGAESKLDPKGGSQSDEDRAEIARLIDERDPSLLAPVAHP